MNVFLLNPLLFEEGTQSAMQSLAPWWVRLLSGFALLIIGVLLYVRRKPLSETESAEFKADPGRINWRVLGPVIIAGVGLWILVKVAGVA